MTRVPSISTLAGRRCGRNDYESFRPVNTSTSSICVGRGEIGKVLVHCRFLFTKAKWGVLGPNKVPSGILHVDIDFEQPEGCRVKSAAIAITLEEGLYGGGIRSTAQQMGEVRSLVNFTDFYGPKDYGGRPKVRHSRHMQDWKPHINAFGNGFGGLGVRVDKYAEEASRWTFSGHLQTKRDTPTGNFDVLKWRLEENDIDMQSLHSNTFHTAFAISHNGKQFRMKVEVEGKLDRFSHRLKHRVKGTFRSKIRDEEVAAVTLVDFGQSYSFTRQLDELAEGLPFKMQEENMRSIPIQVDDSLPARFYADRPRASTGRQQSGVSSTTIPSPSALKGSRAGLTSPSEPQYGQRQDPSVQELNNLICAARFSASAINTPRNPRIRRSNSTPQTPRMEMLFDDGTDDSGDEADEVQTMELTNVPSTPRPSQNQIKDAEMGLLLRRLWILFATALLRNLAFALGLREGKLGKVSDLQELDITKDEFDQRSRRTSGFRQGTSDDPNNGRIHEEQEQGGMEVQADLSSLVEDGDGVYYGD